MAKREKIHFESVDQLLGAPTIKDGTEEIRIDKIHAFKDHPFKVIDDEKMEDLVESIRNGKKEYSSSRKRVSLLFMQHK